MKNQNGFTLIELLIVIAIVFIIGSIALGALKAVSDDPAVNVDGNGNSVVSANVVQADKLPLNIKCQEGYLFMVDKDGNATQVKDNTGAGATCYN